MLTWPDCVCFSVREVLGRGDGQHAAAVHRQDSDAVHLEQRDRARGPRPAARLLHVNRVRQVRNAHHAEGRRFGSFLCTGVIINALAGGSRT